ncbi:hypothetical protein ABKN59_008677 [Abortiporus biennis]
MNRHHLILIITNADVFKQAAFYVVITDLYPLGIRIATFSYGKKTNNWCLHNSFKKRSGFPINGDRIVCRFLRVVSGADTTLFQQATFRTRLVQLLR